jgi:hypothetical protein
LWGVAAVGTVVAIIFPWFFGSPSIFAPLIMSTLVAVVTMSIFLVILKLSYPFGGDYGIVPSAYVAFAQSPSG